MSHAAPPSAYSPMGSTPTVSLPMAGSVCPISVVPDGGAFRPSIRQPSVPIPAASTKAAATAPYLFQGTAFFGAVSPISRW